MLSTPAGTSHGTLANRTLAAMMILGLVVGATSSRPAVAQNNWLGTTSADYFTGDNWSTGSVPGSAEGVRFGDTPYTTAPVYSGDNTATPTGVFEVNGQNNGVFTMASGTLQTGLPGAGGSPAFIVGNAGNTNMATFNMNGGSVTAYGDFRTSHQNGAPATFNMNGGTFDVVSTNNNNQVWFANPGGGDRPNTVTTLVVNGGTFTSNGRIVFGSSNGGNLAIQNARADVTMTGGLMWAKGTDGAGTIQLQGGKMDLQGGIVKGGDLSTRDGWNQVAYGGTGGTNFRGGVMQIDTNLSEGTLYVVPQGVDPATVVGTPFQRGQSRMIGQTFPVYGGTPRFYTTLSDSAVRVWMDTSGPVQQANGFASPKGDYNLDGVVNRADFLLWQNQLGNTYMTDPLAPETSKIAYYGADGNGDGVVTQADFDVWAASIGQAAVGGPYAWAQARTIDVASGSQTQAEAGAATLTFTTASSVTKIGAGTLVMDVANTYTGPTNVNAGTVQVANPLALQSSPVTVQSGGRLALPGDARITVPVGNLSVDQAGGGGSVDVGVGEIDVFRGLSEADLRADLIAGRAGGSWAGATGITSSAAAASGGGRAVGYVVAADGSARVSFAAAGDTDLSGLVNVFDLIAIDSAGKFGTAQAANWSQGDFNYDNIANIFDLIAIDASGVFGRGNYFPAGPGMTGTGGVTAVPEPSAGLLTLAAVVATGLAMRRRRPRSRVGRGVPAACLLFSGLVCVSTPVVAQQAGDAFVVYDVFTGELRMNPGNAGSGGAGSVGNGISSYGIRPNPAVIQFSTVATDFSFLSGSYPLFPPTLGNVTAGDDNTVGAAFFTLGIPNVGANVNYFNNQNLLVSSAVAGTSGATSWGPGAGGVVTSSIPGPYFGTKEWSFGTIGSTGMTEAAALAAFGATTQGGLSSSAQMVYSINGVVGTQNFRVFTTAVPEPATMAIGCCLAALGGVAWRRRRGAKPAIAG